VATKILVNWKCSIINMQSLYICKITCCLDDFLLGDSCTLKIAQPLTMDIYMYRKMIECKLNGCWFKTSTGCWSKWFRTPGGLQTFFSTCTAKPYKWLLPLYLCMAQCHNYQQQLKFNHAGTPCLPVNVISYTSCITNYSPVCYGDKLHQLHIIYKFPSFITTSMHKMSH